MLATRALLPLVLLTALGVGPACSGDADGGADGTGDAGHLSASTAESLEGLYQIGSELEDTAACGAGAAVVDGPPFLIAVASVVFGTQTLVVVSCVDSAECTEFAAGIRDPGTYGPFDFTYTLSDETSARELTGFEASTGFSDGTGTCTERTYTDIVLRADGAGGITLQAQEKTLADRAEEDGYCVVEPARSKTEAATAPCTGQLTVTATRVGDI